MKSNIAIIISCLVLTIWSITYGQYKTSIQGERIASLESTVNDVEGILRDIQYIDLPMMESRQNTAELDIAGMRSQVDIMHEVISSERLRNLRANKVKRAIGNTVKLYKNSSDYEAARQLNRQQMNEIAYTMVDACDKWNVPLNLFLALVRQESAFNHKAKSHAGAMGLTQIVPSTAAEIARKLAVTSYDPYSIQQNIQFGVYYFATLLDMFDNNIPKAVQAYNAGHVMVEKVFNGERNMPRETVHYEQFIRAFAQEYAQQGVF